MKAHTARRVVLASVLPMTTQGVSRGLLVPRNLWHPRIVPRQSIMPLFLGDAPR